jgi:hypothetical protein
MTFVTFTIHRILLNDKTNDGDVGGICDVHGREEIHTLGFGRHAFG